MALMWFLIGTVVLAACGLLTLIAGADTRSGVDGETALGRRTHQAESWW